MIIKGLQKLTLLDYPGRVAATVFTPGCDFRCPFCHNASLVLDEEDQLISEEEVLDLLRKRRGVITGLAITGGEPLLQTDIADFMARVKELGVKIKLDHNGSFPGRLKKLMDAGLLDYVAVDIKNCREKYAMTCGLPESAAEGLLENIQETIDLLKSGSVDFEFRTTVVKELHTAEDIESMGRWMAGDHRFFLQGFVDSGDILRPGLSACSAEEMTAFLDILRRFVPNAQLRGV